MPEVIGDDLTAFIKNARQKGHIPNDFLVPFANTPSFNGAHVHGYDAMLMAILLHDLTLSWRRRGNLVGGVVFYVIAASLFPLAMRMGGPREGLW